MSLLSLALYGPVGRPVDDASTYLAPPLTFKRGRPAKAQNALVWKNKTRDMSPTRLIVDMPINKTVFGRASAVTESTTAIDNQRSPTRDSEEFATWKKKMGVVSRR